MDYKERAVLYERAGFFDVLAYLAIVLGIVLIALSFYASTPDRPDSPDIFLGLIVLGIIVLLIGILSYLYMKKHPISSAIAKK